MFRIRLLFTLTIITSAISAQDASFCSELKSIREIVATSHYQPKTENFYTPTNPLRNELLEFVDSIEKNRKPLTDVDHAIAVAKNLDLLESFC